MFTANCCCNGCCDCCCGQFVKIGNVDGRRLIAVVPYMASEFCKRAKNNMTCHVLSVMLILWELEHREPEKDI